jgi:exopolyphosphatase/guanosine-5'-triphosphate,3'-diphosphate pyrophosphatase
MADCLSEAQAGTENYMRIAAIDLGSNSFHILIAQIAGPSSFAPVIREKMTIQLGRTALITGRLDPRDIARGLRCLDEFRRLVLTRRVERTIAVATSAIREAENGAEFLRRVREKCGFNVRAISGREEARLIHLAVARTVDLGSERALLADIGGGSVELSVADQAKIYFSTSLKLGFLRLQGRFVTKDPMTRREMRTLSVFLRDSLAGPLATARRRGPTRLIATGGAMDSLLRLARQRRDPQPRTPLPADRVSRKEIRATISDLRILPSSDRAEKFDLDPSRAETLPIALMTLEAILEGAGIPRAEICPAALREGLIYDFLDSARTAEPAPSATGDLRMQAILDLARRCDYPAEHSHRVASLAGQIFEQTRSLHGLGEYEGRLLQYGSLLHDIGYHISYVKHHKHAYYLVMNCDLRGFTQAERSVLANIVRYHRRAAPKPSHASLSAMPAQDREVVCSLAAILRIADALDASRFSVVESVIVRPGRGRLVFQLVTNSMQRKIPLDLDTVSKRAGYFEKRFGVDTVFRIRRPPRGTREQVQARAV